MSYTLTLRPMGVASTLRIPYATLFDGMLAIEQALKDGYHRTPKILMVLGEGACLNLISDEETTRLDAADRIAAQSGGLQVQSRYISDNPDGYVLHTQLGNSSMPPMFFDTEAEITAIVDATVEKGFLKHVFKHEHDYLYVKLGSGMMFITMSVADYEMQRRATLEQHQRQAAKALAQAQDNTKRIILGR